MDKVVAIGNAGTGTPMHFHGPTFNVLLEGRKMWLFRTPHDALWSNANIADFFESEGGQASLCGIQVGPYLTCIYHCATIMLAGAW